MKPEYQNWKRKSLLARIVFLEMLASTNKQTILNLNTSVSTLEEELSLVTSYVDRVEAGHKKVERLCS